jgi:hypothetical protein
MEEPWPLAERLSSIAADLLSVKRFEPFVRQLFAAAPGSWQTVAACCSALAGLPQHAAEAFAHHGDSFVVTYLPWPGGSYGRPHDRYALVLFVHNEELWSSIAAYNLAGLTPNDE